MDMDSIDTSSVELALQDYLPRRQDKLFVTATWAQSLDGRIAAAPGQRTQLSGAYSKKMTHFLRTKHDAILVGRGTMAADNPRLNSRYSADAASPRPVVLDSGLSWDLTRENWRQWQVLNNAAQGLCKAPWVVVSAGADPVKQEIIERAGGRVLRVQDTHSWPDVCRALQSAGIGSLMVEGGAEVLDSCLHSGVVDSVVITIAPVFLGRDGVQLSPHAPLRLREVAWWREQGIEDSVLAAVL